jgi:thymidylate kinase
MTFIELYGQVGSGKSTVAQAAQRLFLEAGFEPVDMKTAIARCLARSRLGRLAGRAPDAHRRRLLKGVYRYGLYPLYSLRLALTNPRLFGAVIRAQLGNGLPWWHKRKIWRLFFNLANGLAFVSGRLAQDEIVLLEEGLLHRAVNLFSWHMDGVQDDLLRRYLDHLPVLDLVVYVEAPMDSCRERMLARGLPSRLRPEDDETTAHFFENAGHVVALISAHVAGSGRPAIVVDNGGRRGQFEAALRAALSRAIPALDRQASWPALV